MKKLLIAILSLFLMVSLAVTASAQEYKKKTVIDFDDVMLEGELKKPAGAYIKERKELKFKKLIKTRTNFESEMFKSVDSLK